MRVCVTVEGAYPYVTGGVSSWVDRMIKEFRDTEFVIQTIVVDRKQKRRMRYKIPENVSQIQEVYLFDDDYVKSYKKQKLTQEEYSAFETLFQGQEVAWEIIFNFFYKNDVSLDSLLKSKEFLELTKSYYLKHHDDMVFTDFLWSMRSMYQPLFTILKSPIVEADLYHSLSTGYSGVLASMQKYINKKPLLLSEHGIYTREREAEIIQADWVSGVYKDLWIEQFYRLSSCGYGFADKVTSLYSGARDIQVELGCEKEKTIIIPNGVDIDGFTDLAGKDESDGSINIGAILRVTRIKDVKTMINAFYLAKTVKKNLKLWIIGPLDEEPDYAKECRQLVLDLNLEDVVFTGTVNIKEYLGKMDFFLLSSLSEGQPLVILEAFAAKKPSIATNVGSCKELIYGDGDDYGHAGIIVPLMNTDKMSKAILTLAEDQELRESMGANGYNRVKNLHQNREIYARYFHIYSDLTGSKSRKSEVETKWLG